MSKLAEATQIELSDIIAGSSENTVETAKLLVDTRAHLGPNMVRYTLGLALSVDNDFGFDDSRRLYRILELLTDEQIWGMIELLADGQCGTCAERLQRGDW